MAKEENNTFLMCVVGSRDFSRRVITYFDNRSSNNKSASLSLISGNPSELYSLIVEEKPQFLLLEIGLNVNQREIQAIREDLLRIRKRFNRRISIILAITSPQKMVFAGDLLFKDNSSTAASGFIDDLVITPPPRIPSTLPLEQQIENSVEHFIESIMESKDGTDPLPALWDDFWAPSICAPTSREVWKRWLPRYAKYASENPLIIGPTGSGKTRLAAACHALSERSGPFISITPRDFSSSELVQAELFGSVTGAFTGAIEKWGLVKKAEKGTLFVDELQSIDLDLQGKLITFIENKEYRRVGESERQKADVRFIFATNRPLDVLVSEGKLRDDFAYRLERLQLSLIPLRERRLDISAGLTFSLAKVLRERYPHNSLQVEGLSLEAYANVFGDDWPGNLRQLENATARAVEHCVIDKRKIISAQDFQNAISGLLGNHAIDGNEILQTAVLNTFNLLGEQEVLGLSELQNTLAKEARKMALEQSGGQPDKASELIGDSPKAMKLFADTHSHAFNESSDKASKESSE